MRLSLDRVAVSVAALDSTGRFSPHCETQPHCVPVGHLTNVTEGNPLKVPEAAAAGDPVP